MATIPFSHSPVGGSQAHADPLRSPAAHIRPWLAGVRGLGLSAPLLAAIAGPPLAFLAATALVTLRTGIEPAFFARDPASTLGGHPLTGVQSHLGVLLWCATASICVFSHAIVRRRALDPDVSSLLLCFGLLTFVLAFDDLFRVHEDLASRYLGVRQRYVLLAYGIACLSCLVRFRTPLLRSEFGLLGLALGFFGLSLLIDTFERSWPSRWCIFFEDGFKLLGIVFWATFLVRTGFDAVSASFRDESPTPADVRT